ncbi:cytochrome P450 [Streptomyces sp. NPDC057253]|uniref:cytochrome P450 n=1 Tax=Streptomyces sp. NPDC057253 TaxID=3346069 RepID=UPI00362B3201
MNQTDARIPGPPSDFRFVGAGPAGQGLDRYDRLRQDHSVVRVDEPQGSYWVVLKRELIRACLQDPATFSSRSVTILNPDPPVAMIPIQLDPPEHRPWRHLLAGYFSPKRMAALRPRLERGCRELIESIEGRDRCDFVKEFATRFPTVVFLELVGLPPSELDTFLTWEHEILRPDPDGAFDPGRYLSGVAAVRGYFTEVLAARRASGTSGDDLIGQALTWELDGEPVPDEALLSCLFLLFLAGLDTVTNTLAFALYHLATHDEDRRQAAQVARAGLPMGDIVEELLRYYAIPELSRKVTRDVDIDGHRFKAGDMVLFPLVSANRDAEGLEEADRVRFDRDQPPVHFAFGAGPHRCLGSHLAREELTVALGEWHRRLPDYRLDPDVAVIETWGSVHGLDSLPLLFSTGKEHG